MVDDAVGSDNRIAGDDGDDDGGGGGGDGDDDGDDHNEQFPDVDDVDFVVDYYSLFDS